MSMGERLRELRLKRSISQEEVARHIGITRSAYSHYEINNRQPVYETLIKLAAFFDVSLDYIIGGTTNPADSVRTKEVQEMIRLLQDMSQEQRRQSLDMLIDLLKSDNRPDQSKSG